MTFRLLSDFSGFTEYSPTWLSSWYTTQEGGLPGSEVLPRHCPPADRKRCKVHQLCPHSRVPIPASQLCQPNNAKCLGSPFKFQPIPPEVLSHLRFCRPHVICPSSSPQGSRVPRLGQTCREWRWPCPRPSILCGDPGKSSLPGLSSRGGGDCSLGNNGRGLLNLG